MIAVALAILTFAIIGGVLLLTREESERRACVAETSEEDPRGGE